VKLIGSTSFERIKVEFSVLVVSLRFEVALLVFKLIVVFAFSKFRSLSRISYLLHDTIVYNEAGVKRLLKAIDISD